MGLVRNAFKRYEGKRIHSIDIAPHIILTGWKFHSKLKSPKVDEAGTKREMGEETGTTGRGAENTQHKERDR